jgi:signal transduction histidine kinase/ligand-binding sensor domain-containing protein/CheY-like chemotaxis protein
MTRGCGGRLAAVLAALVVALVAPGPASADGLVETPRFRVLGAAEGLPSETVYALAQDHEGYLWVGTADGLARFDGVEFVVYQQQPDDPASLPSNVIQALHVDAAGRVWVGTEGGGLSMLAPGAAGFRHYRRESTAGLALDDVWAIASTADGAVWFGGYAGGLYRLDPADDRLQAFAAEPGRADALASLHVLALAVAADGSLWVGGNNGLQRWTGSGFEAAAGTRSPLIFSLGAAADGGLWIGSAGGLDHRAADGRIGPAVQGESLAEPGVTAVLGEPDDRAWIATRTGLYRWRQGGLHPQLLPAPRSDRPLPRVVYQLLRDHEGGLWFASGGGGLLHLPPGWRDFSVLRPDPQRPDSLSSPAPLAVAAADDGQLWVVGKDGGLDRLDPRSGQVQRLLEAAEALPNRRLSAVLQDAAGVVWLGHHLGLSRFDPETGALSHWLAGQPGGPPKGPVDLLLDDGAGGLWLSAWGGGIERRAADGRVLARWVPGDGLQDAHTEQLTRGPDGALWVASASGLARLDPGGRLQPLAGLPAGRVHAFAFDRSDGLWLHRFGALEHYRIDAGNLRLQRRVGSEDGLPAVEAGGLRIDRDGRLWLTTRRGLWQFRPADGQWRSYGIRDGLSSQELGDRPPLQLASGLIAMTAVDSLVLFDPQRLFQPNVTPRLRLHRLQWQRDGVDQRIAPTGAMRLRHGDRELHVAARLVSFGDPAAHRYRFWLQGHDDGWIDTGSLDERVYSLLPAGRYRLLVDAVDGHGRRPAAPLALDVEVLPPWWQSGPARLVQLLLLVLLAVAAWRLQRRRLARRHAAELAERERQWALQSSEAKSRFLATLGHEIRTPMTGVLGMTELLLRSELGHRQRGHAEAIQRSGELMLRLLNDALDLARIEAGRLPLEARPFDLQRLLGEVTEQQGPLAEARGLQFRLEADPAVARWRRGDLLRVKQVLLNLTGNAIKFTEQGFVALRLLPAGQSGFELQVADSGPGLNEQQRARLFQRFAQADGATTSRLHGGSGLGLAISQELVAAMGGRILLESSPGRGSCFRVQLDLPEVQPDTHTPPSPAPLAAAGSGQRILLVEDDATVAEVLRELLAAAGFAVSHVPHGLAALAELETAAPFDLAILDLDLPGVDGLSLARMLRQQRPALPLLALTARSDPGAEPEALAAGFARFLRKPVDAATLAATAATVCQSPRPATLPA